MSSIFDEDRLSLCDIIMPHVYIRCLLVYNYHIDDLEQSFNDYLDRFCPQAFKRIVYDDQKRMVGRIVDCESGHKRQVFSRESRPNESISKYLNNDSLTEDIFPYGMIPTDLSPLIFMHQINVHDGTLLTVGCHHYLSDGHGSVHWVKEKTSPLFDHNRSKLQHLAVSSSIEFDHPEMSIVDPIYSLRNLSPVQTIVKRYTKSDLFNKLKITNTHGIISMNDVLVGWLAQMISRIRHVPRHSTVKVGMAMNGRTLLPGIGSNYFGNCSLYLCLSFPMSDLDDFTVDELARRINIEKRKLMTREYIQSALAFIEKHHRSSTIHLGWQTIGGYDLSFTNWTRFPLDTCDFGQGGVTCFKLSQIAIDGLIFILPTSNKDEIELHISLQHEHAQLLLSKLV